MKSAKEVGKRLLRAALGGVGLVLVGVHNDKVQYREPARYFVYGFGLSGYC